MSEAIAFDTHRFVKNLTASGFTETQAEALADEQVNLLNSNLATKDDVLAVKSEILATDSDVREVQAAVRTVQADVRAVQAELREVKSDVREVKLELELKIEQVRSDLEVKIEKARVGLARWMLTGWVTQTGLLATLFWYFSSGPPGG